MFAFVGKGLNPPLRGVNVWMYDHVPGMFLLREPMGKVGALLAPAIVLGWVLTIEGLESRWRLERERRPARRCWVASR